MGAVTTVNDGYPVELDDVIVLSDRQRVHVRALRRFEDAPIRELFDHLSPRTRYLRFLSPLHTLPESIVARLAGVDYCRNLALVAEYDGGSRREVVALGSFGAVDDQHVELALVVRDDWQRRRLGTELAIRVMDAAEARGFHRFVATFLCSNGPVRRLLRHVADVVSATASAGVSELVLVRHRAGDMTRLRRP